MRKEEFHRRGRESEQEMEVEYLREMRQNYLMIQVEESREQGYEARMMIGNTIDGLLRFRIKKSDILRLIKSGNNLLFP